GLAPGGEPPARLLHRTDGGARTTGRMGNQLQPAARAGERRGSATALSTDGDRRRDRRGLSSDRRLPRSERTGPRAGGRRPARWGLDGIAPDFNNRLLPEDWPRFMPLSQNAITRVPALEKGDVVKLINGPEAFTPDNEFLLGESAVRGFYVAAGFCAHGIAGAGGMGAAMAEWIIDGEPSLDLWKMDLRRFGGQYRSQAYTRARTVEAYSTYYD